MRNGVNAIVVSSMLGLVASLGVGAAGCGSGGSAEVTKRLWAYIKERNLQNPANKRIDHE